jgi:hypothetical protein
MPMASNITIGYGDDVQRRLGMIGGIPEHYAPDDPAVLEKFFRISLDDE